jgi:RecB family endonuclease NucS
MPLLRVTAENKVKESKKVSVLVNPTLLEAESLIKKTFAQRSTLIVAGNCRVKYVGRASSTLEPGERMLIIKADGALLVHRPVAYEPVNWQPAGSIFRVQTKAESLEIRGVRQKPRESVTLTFDSVFLVSSLNLVDSGEFILNASEYDMHKAVLLKPSLLEEGFKPISYEKHIEPGFMDIYGEDKNGKLVVVEVKRKTAGKEAVLQLARYIEAVKTKANRKVRGILAAPRLGKDMQRLLATLGLEFKALEPKKCALVLTKVGTAKLDDFWKDKPSA